MYKDLVKFHEEFLVWNAFPDLKMFSSLSNQISRGLSLLSRTKDYHSIIKEQFSMTKILWEYFSACTIW